VLPGYHDIPGTTRRACSGTGPSHIHPLPGVPVAVLDAGPLTREDEPPGANRSELHPGHPSDSAQRTNRWTLTIDHTKILSAAGVVPMAADFVQSGIRRLLGGATGDGRVDNADFFLFRSTFGLRSGLGGIFGGL
jgi:hypothetical protein